MEPATIENPPEAPPPPFADAVAASTEADANRIEPVREFEMTLPVAMTDDEHHAHGDALAQAHKTLDEIKSETATEKARHKVEMEALADRLDEALGIAGKLAREIRDRKLSKLVACREEKVFATGVIRVVRLDTGEFVEERPMSKHERQADLFPAATESESPESFSSLADDESEPPPAEPAEITIGGTIVELTDQDEPRVLFIELGGVRTKVLLGGGCEGYSLLVLGDVAEFRGNYMEHGGKGALFVASAIVKVESPAKATIDDPAAVLGPEEQPKKRRGRK